MRLPSLLSLVLLTLFVSQSVFASGIDVGIVSYTDAPVQDRRTMVDIAFLLQENVLDATKHSFSPLRSVSRAEFVTMVMRTLPADSTAPSTACYRDIHTWFALSVCRAKARSLIGENHADPFFHPMRSVNMAEATKILAKAYGLSIDASVSGAWYEPYISMASSYRLFDTSAMQPDTVLTRTDAVHMLASYFAFHRGELAMLRAAERGEVFSSLSSSLSSSSSTSSFSSSALIDPDTNTVVRSTLLLLGKRTPPLAGISIFVSQEPLEVTSIHINLNAPVRSVSSLLVFDHNRRLIGRAYGDSGFPKGYTLTLPSGAFTVPQAIDTRLYVRADVLARDDGGRTGEIIEVNNIVIQGNGHWSNAPYVRSSSEAFPAFETTRSLITGIANADASHDFFLTGLGRKIGSFVFSGDTSDGTANIFLRDLIFHIGAIGGAQVFNVQLGANGTVHKLPCTLSGSLAFCLSLPDDFSSLVLGNRTLTLYGDVSNPSGSPNPRLSVSLNEPGNILTPGSVHWTDGTTAFDWVQFDPPVAQGTLYQ